MTVSTRQVGWAMLAAASLPWLAYVWGIAPSPYLLDSPELVAAAATQGISHPPGHPSYAQLAGVLTALPAGNVAMRVHLFSALCVTLALALLPLTAVRARIANSVRDLGIVVAVAWTIGAAAALWFQAVRAEVYALHLLTVATASCWLIPVVGARVSPDAAAGSGTTDDHPALDPPAPARVGVGTPTSADTTHQRLHREVAAGALVLGVGLLNHHYLLVFALPGLLLWAAVRAWPAGPVGFGRIVATAIVAGTLPLAGYLWLWLRGLAQAWPSWGWPTTAADVWWLVSAQAFQATAGRVQTMDPAAGVQNVVGLWADQLGPGVAALFVLAAVTATVAAPRVFVPLAVLVVCNIVTQVLFDFDPLNPDVGGYFMASFWWAALALGWLLIALAGQLGGLRARAASALAAALPLLVLLGANPDARPAWLASFWAVESFGDEDFHPLPPDAVVVTAYFETGFQAWYTLGVGDLRPDVQHLHRAWRTWPYLDPMLLARSPSLAPLLEADGRRGLVSVEAMRARAATTDVVWEPDPLLVGVDASALRVCGRLLCVVAAGSAPPPDSQEAAAILGQAERSRVQGAAETQVQRNRLWSAFNRACVLCDGTRPQSCRAQLEVARALAPTSPEVAALAAGQTAVCRGLAR